MVIIGFPTNQFTGNFKDNEEIKKFIDENNISFIVTKETKVNGFNQDSIYKYIGNESSSMKNINEDFEKVCSFTSIISFFLILLILDSSK